MKHDRPRPLRPGERPTQPACHRLVAAIRDLFRK